MDGLIKTSQLKDLGVTVTYANSWCIVDSADCMLVLYLHIKHILMFKLASCADIIFILIDDDKKEGEYHVKDFQNKD